MDADSPEQIAVRPFSGTGEALRGVLRAVAPMLEGSTVFVAALDPERDAFLVVDALGAGGCEVPVGQEEPLSESFCLHMVAGRAPELCNHASQHNIYGRLSIRSRCGIESYIGIPIELSHGRTVGTLCAVAPESDRYDEVDLATVRRAAKLVAQELEHRWGRYELQEVVDRLRHQALIDDLTGLSNRAAFERATERQWQTMHRNEDAAGYVLVADLDSLKQVNDTNGHAAGDTALIQAAQALAGAARASDLVARCGGDEVAALLIDCDSDDDARAFIARARQTNDAPTTIASRLSFGFCSLAHAPSSQAAIERADELMYQDKRSRATRPCMPAQPREPVGAPNERED